MDSADRPLAVITLAFSGHHHARQIVASVFLMLWGARLSGFLLFRIIKTGKDDRFDDKRDRFFPFLGFWVFQMVSQLLCFIRLISNSLLAMGLDSFPTCHGP